MVTTKALIFILLVSLNAFGITIQASLPLTTKWEPLPIDILSEIEDPTHDSMVIIKYWDYTALNEDDNFMMTLSYGNYEGELIGSGVNFAYTVNYSHEFPSNQEFFDLIDYIEQHPDVFFNYSEFADYEPNGFFWPPDGTEKVFHLAVARYPADNEYHDYCIVKFLLAEDPAPEIQYVIDTLEAEFRDELTQHPVPEEMMLP